MTTFQITVFPLLDFIILYLVPFALICNYQITKYGDFETYTFFYSFDNISPIFGPPFRISPETEVKL
jgi:hypothetical protein